MENDTEDDLVATEVPPPSPGQYCNCGHCKQMPSLIESSCCGEPLEGCITEHSLLNDLLKSDSLEINLRQYWFMIYKFHRSICLEQKGMFWGFLTQEISIAKTSDLGTLFD